MKHFEFRYMVLRCFKVNQLRAVFERIFTTTRFWHFFVCCRSWRSPNASCDTVSRIANCLWLFSSDTALRDHSYTHSLLKLHVGIKNNKSNLLKTSSSISNSFTALGIVNVSNHTPIQCSLDNWTVSSVHRVGRFNLQCKSPGPGAL